MSKTVVILGSPRKGGNSETLATAVSDRLAAAGSEVIVHRLNRLTYKGCQACGACKSKAEHCVVKDDLSPVLEDFAAADNIILASPVYWGEVSGQTKCLLDRLYSFLTPDFMTAAKKHRLPPGKRLVFILTQGAEPEGFFDDIFPRYNGFFSQLKWFEESILLRGLGVNAPGDAAKKEELLKEARAIGDRLAGR